MSRRNTTRRLQLQSLEYRRVMAGNVSVSVSSGNLVIDGDDLNNALSITPVFLNGQAIPGRFRITGLNTVGSQPTLLNGVNAPITVQGVTGDVRIDLDGGNDGLLIGNRVTAPRDLSITTDDGIDFINLDQVRVGDDLTINAGAGNDTVFLNRVNVGLAGVDGGFNNASLSMGNDRDVAIVRSTFVRRDLDVQMGFGTAVDTLSADVLTVGRNMNVQTDDGADQIALGNAFIGDDLRIDTDSGNDNISLFNIFADDLFAEMDSGLDNFRMQLSSVRDDIFLDTGSDNDTVRFDTVSAGDDLRVELGGGDDSLTVQNSSALDAFFFGEGESTATGDRRLLQNNQFNNQILSDFEGFLP